MTGTLNLDKKFSFYIGKRANFFSRPGALNLEKKLKLTIRYFFSKQIPLTTPSLPIL